MEDGFTSDQPLPLFEHEERGSLLLLNASILFLVASLVAMAIILSFGNPAKVFMDIKASLIDISTLQPDTVQSTPTSQSAADARALPPRAWGAPTSHEVAAEISAAPPSALLKQFQDWQANDDARAQIDAARRAQDARAQVLRGAQAHVLSIQKGE